MDYTFVSASGEFGRTLNFQNKPPTLAPNKGKWLADTPPNYDPDEEVLVRVAPQNGDTSVTYSVQRIPLETRKQNKIAELDTSKAYFENLPVAGTNNGVKWEIRKPENLNTLTLLWLSLKASPGSSGTMLDDNGVEVTFTDVNLNVLVPMVLNAKTTALGRYSARKTAIENAPNETALNAIETNLSR